MNLKDCIPASKFDHEAVQNARALGFPAINPIIPDLLEWMRDANWPVAQDVIDLLSGAGDQVVPSLNSVLEGEDAIWKYWVLDRLCPRLSESCLAALRSTIARLANSPTQQERNEGVDEAARLLLEC